MAIQRAVVQGTLFSAVQVRNIFTCEVVPFGSDDAETLWTAYLDPIYVEIMNMLVNDLVYTHYDIQQLVAGQWEMLQQVDFSYTGSGEADTLPNAVAVVLLGAAAGIRHIGRKFFSGIAESLATANALTGGGITAAAAALLAYITPFEGLAGGTITPGVVDKNGVFHPFVGGVVSSILGSMRRRKPGVGI